jgi:IS5 family transposase
VAAWLCRRNADAKDEVLAITASLAFLAEATIVDARAAAVNARRSLTRLPGRSPGREVHALAEIDRVAGLLEAIVAQTRVRVNGGVPDGSTRVVSLHDPDDRRIRKGRLGRPVEFGYKAQVADNADGLVLDHTVVVGTAPDAPVLEPGHRPYQDPLRQDPTAGHRLWRKPSGDGDCRTDQAGALDDVGVEVVVIMRFAEHRGADRLERGEDVSGECQVGR